MRDPKVQKRPLYSVWFPLLLATLLSACAGIGKYRDPVRVSVSDIQVIEATLLEQLYAVTLRVQNPNPDALALRGGSFDLEINGKDFGHGVSDAKVTVPAFGDAKVEVRMVSTLFGMLRLVQSFQERERESLSYEISGRLHLQGGIGGMHFEESGELTLPRAPDTAPGV
jgi:LEA14-like dessication related protein